MPRQLSQYRIFIGSPGGLREEREAFRRIITTFNELHGESAGIVFSPVGWEDTLGGVGRPQELINEDLRQCDFAIFVFHDRWGSPSGSSGKVGTEEEWDIAQELYDNKSMRKVCLFFKHVDSGKLKDAGPQLQKVLDFKAKIESGKKHLFQAYPDAASYCTALEKHLANWMREIVGATAKESAAPSQSIAEPTVQSFEAEPSFSFWLAQARQLTDRNFASKDLAAARFCAARALKLARTDAEWADAENVRAVALEDHKEAYDSFSALAARFLESRDAVLRSKAARALINKGFRLGQLGRREEEIAIYDDVISRFGTADEAASRELIAWALCNKGAALGELGRREEEIAIYDDVISRFGTADEAASRELIAWALCNKGAALGELGRSEEEIVVYDGVIGRFGATSEAQLRNDVARAMANKAVTLGQLGRNTDSIAVSDEVIARFGTANQAALREQVVRALVSKGIGLQMLNRVGEAIAVYDDVIGRFGTVDEAASRELVEHAKRMQDELKKITNKGRGKPRKKN